MKKLSSLLLLLLLFTFVTPAQAEWNAAKDSNTLGDPEAKILLDFVENMPWIADGADTGKYLYVLADAGCQYTKQLYTMTRKYTKDVQIRWIFVDGMAEGTYNSLYEERTPEALNDAFMSLTLPADKNPEQSAKIDQYVLKGFIVMIMRGLVAPAPDRFAYPTLIYGTPEKVIVDSGLDVSGLGTVMTSLPVVPVKKDFVPLALTADESKVKLLPVPAGYKYTNNSTENAQLYMMPDQNAPRLGALLAKVESPFPCVGMTEDGFIAMKLEPTNSHIYCYDPAEVKRVQEKK